MKVQKAAPIKLNRWQHVMRLVVLATVMTNALISWQSCQAQASNSTGTGIVNGAATSASTSTGTGIGIVDGADTSASTNSAGAQMSLSELKAAANDAFWKRNYKVAIGHVEKILTFDLSKEDRARALTNLAICQSQLDEWKDVSKNCLDALQLTSAKSLTAADALLLYARHLLLDGKMGLAELNFRQGIDTAVALQGAWNTDLAAFYEGLAGCYLKEGKLAQAAEAYKKAAQLDLLKYGADDAPFAWSLLSLSAVEKQLGHADLAATLYKKVFWSFRHQNEIRILQENKDAAEQPAFVESLHKQLYGEGYNNRDLGLDFIKDGMPKEAFASPATRTETFDQWYRERIGRKESPGLCFFDPTKKLKGLIATVHGLGLSHSAFTPFAERIQHEGYGVISFDVRGFGTYRHDEIYGTLDLQAVIGDLTRILTGLKGDYPGIPIVLLGESMGGAIVLHLLAVAPHLVDAVISSVPSGSRYGGKRTALQVGLKLLKNKNEPFDIGSSVIAQATKKPDVRDMWEGDPQSRLRLTPKELLNFQKFMGENTKCAQQITKTPVMIFQGYSDNLVKPMGTLQIYQAIANRDKDLTFIGRSEHLIFEEGQCDEDIYNGVVGWLKSAYQRSIEQLGI